MQEQFANQAVSALSVAITATATSLVVASAATFPSVPQFRILIHSELLLVTAVNGTTFTVVRGIEGTAAACHAANAVVTHIITAGGLVAAIGSRPHVDFVMDCGADATGATNCASAFELMRVLLTTLSADNATLPQSPLTGFFPRGLFTLSSILPNNPWDFNGLTTSARLRGTGMDSSIIQYQNGGEHGPIFSNIYDFSAADLTCLGNGPTPGVDCASSFTVSATDMCVFERVRFANFSCAQYVVRVQVGPVVFRNCDFTNCATISGTTPIAVVHSNGAAYVELDCCTFYDVGHMNGYVLADKTASNAGPWFRHDDSQPPGSGAQQRGVVIRGCIFDESAIGSVVVVGGPTSNVSFVKMESNTLSPSIIGSPTACVSLQDVNQVVIDGLINTGFNTVAVLATLELKAVASTVIRGLVVNNSAASNYITADSACDSLEIHDSPTLLAANVRSLAKRTVIVQSGVWADLAVASATVVANALVKRTATNGAPTVAHVETSDSSFQALGPCLDPASPMVNTRVARVGQRVTVLNDGAASIAVGDAVTVSTLTAGRVMKQTTPANGFVGYAMSAAPATADAAFDILFLPIA